MPVELLIDGYNLLHNAGLGKSKYGPGEFDRARDQLLKRLRNSLTEEERTHTSIIFDAQYSAHPDRRPLNIYGMTVLFSPRGRQADDLIEILLAGHSTPREIRVISSDHRLQRAARAARADYMSSDGFLVELDERKNRSPVDRQEVDIPRPPQQPVSNSKADGLENHDWMEEFGSIDISSITQEVMREPGPRHPLAGQSQSGAEQTTPASQSPHVSSPTDKDSPAVTPPVPAKADQQLEGMPASTEETSSLAADLDFWEGRIQELAAEESDSLPPHRRRRK